MFFCVVFLLLLMFQKTITWIWGWVGLAWPIRVFLGSFFSLEHLDNAGNLSYVAPFRFRKCLELYFVWLNIYAGDEVVCPRGIIVT